MDDSLRDRLADSTRRLMDAVVRTEAADGVVAAALTRIDDAVALLSSATRESMPYPDAAEFARGVARYNPVIGTANPYAPPMTCRVAGDGTVVGEVTLEPIHEGPPGYVHGGVVATLLDQLLGHAIAVADASGMTAELTVRYRRPTPFGVPLRVVGRHVSTDGRRVVATGEVLAGGDVTAEATGLFLRPTAAQRSRMLSTMAASADGAEATG